MEDNTGFRLIGITSENPVEDEGSKIKTLLDEGFFRVHIRHPAASRIEIRDIVESIPIRFHRRIVLHGYFDLAADFNLGGLHLNRRCPIPPSFYNGSLSRSCHSLEEIDSVKGMEYVTLSPVFDSISKQGYKSSFSEADLNSLRLYHTPVFALGGVTFKNLEVINKYNFSGAAMLGALQWELPIKSFIRNIINNLSTC